MNHNQRPNFSNLTQALISILFAGNVFFVQRLVQKVESTGDEVSMLRQQIGILNYRIDDFLVSNKKRISLTRRGYRGQYFREGNSCQRIRDAQFHRFRLSLPEEVLL